MASLTDALPGVRPAFLVAALLLHCSPSTPANSANGGAAGTLGGGTGGGAGGPDAAVDGGPVACNDTRRAYTLVGPGDTAHFGDPADLVLCDATNPQHRFDRIGPLLCGPSSTTVTCGASACNHECESNEQ